MNISALSSSMPLSFFNHDDQSPKSQSLQSIGDVVNFNALPDMTDDEVEELMQETLSMIDSDSLGALSVHSGLDPERVFALLEA